MGDVLINFLRRSLPDELAQALQDSLQKLQDGKFEELFQLPEVQVLLGHQDSEATKDVQIKNFPNWSDYVFHRLGVILSKRNEEQGTPSQETAAYRQHLFFIVAVACIYAFLQSNATGPTLPFESAETLLPKDISSNGSAVSKLRQDLIASFSVDGVAAYKLTPNIELLSLAETILICPPIQKNIQASIWARLRVNLLHQRLLSEVAPSLQKSIYEDVDTLSNVLLSPGTEFDGDTRVHFLLERAAIHTHHGLDKKARADLDQATKERKFEFALTGLIGKRTKFQQKATSQLVVLAKSAGTPAAAPESTKDKDAKPQNLDLNDDTLLESISFTQNGTSADMSVKDEASLPSSLAGLDPSNQPLLDPLDSVILLSLASSITNTNPADGLTREETEPYATRVLEGGSSNWQVYTQALLVRSRIEGYKSRTMERGLLQLQALVDQVIAETSGGEAASNGETGGAAQTTSFLPKAKEGESAPVSERLRYIFPLCTPSRWELESELAQRWVSAGGLRTALEIYERLEMWAEAALCWAATEKEDRARKIIRRQLFHASNDADESPVDLDEEEWNGKERDPSPAEAPRLYCILGDIGKDTSMYEKAWEVSNHRYARAQRSLGRQYFVERKYEEAAKAYRLSLKVNGLHGPSWFALGCAYLELQQFKNAVEAFSRCVQLDDQDAEAWSNLAAALLHLRPKSKATIAAETENRESADGDEEIRDGEEHANEEKRISSHPRQDALKAFLRAATLKHENSRIWSNVLAVAASTTPPAYQHIVTAQRRLCELRGPTDGEKCVDAEILDLLVKHTVTEAREAGAEFDVIVTKPGLPSTLR